MGHGDQLVTPRREHADVSVHSLPRIACGSSGLAVHSDQPGARARRTFRFLAGRVEQKSPEVGPMRQEGVEPSAFGFVDQRSVH